MKLLPAYTGEIRVRDGGLLHPANMLPDVVGMAVSVDGTVRDNDREAMDGPQLSIVSLSDAMAAR